MSAEVVLCTHKTTSLPVWIISSQVHHRISTNSQPFLVGIVSRLDEINMLLNLLPGSNVNRLMNHDTDRKNPLYYVCLDQWQKAFDASGNSLDDNAYTYICLCDFMETQRIHHNPSQPDNTVVALLIAHWLHILTVRPVILVAPSIRTITNTILPPFVAAPLAASPSNIADIPITRPQLVDIFPMPQPLVEVDALQFMPTWARWLYESPTRHAC